VRIERMARVVATAGVLSQGGCATTKPGFEVDANVPATRYIYSTGRGAQDFEAAPAAVKVAVFEALDDLKMTVKRRDLDGTVTQVDGRTADDRTVTVTIRPQQKATQVACRIGWFGDDPLSRSLLERVGVRLGTRPPAAIPEHPPSAPASNPIFSRSAVPDSEMFRDIAEAPYRSRPDP